MSDISEKFFQNIHNFQNILSEEFSKYILYVDESGDHGVASVDTHYPLFVLDFCIFEKSAYAEIISPMIRKFKFKHFVHDHDMFILHEQEIRKARNDFKFLVNADHRHDFMTDINLLIHNTPFTLISVVIDKLLHQEKYSDSSNPYHLAMQFGLERIYSFMRDKQEHAKVTHIIFESRRKKEDTDLELEFNRTCIGNNMWSKPLPFKLISADKHSNSCRLQIADLIGRRIGRHILDSTQENRVFQILRKKVYAKNGHVKRYGLKCFP